MTDAGTPPVGLNAVTMLHRALVGGLTVIVAIFSFLIYQRGGALLAAEPSQDLIGLVIGGAGLVPLALGFLVFRPRVPARRPGETAEAYWSQPEASGRALLVWVLFEGSGTIGATGYLLSGHLAAGFTAAAGLAALVLSGPGFLGGRQD